MRSMEKLCNLLEEKIQEHTERGLTTSNIDLVYKMVDILKDIKNIEYWDIKSDYYSDQMQGGYSGNYYRNDGYSEDDGYSAARRKRDSRGRYSRNGDAYSYDSGDGRMRSGHGNREYDSYVSAKHSYRNGGGSDCKQRLMNTLEDYMDNFSKQMEDMLRDADCTEERETIQRYLHKLKNLG